MSSTEDLFSTNYIDVLKERILHDLNYSNNLNPEGKSSKTRELANYLAEQLKNNSNDKNKTKLDAVKEQLKDLPSLLDEDTLTKLKNGGFDITLREYTDLNTYRTMMTTLYGNYSSDKFQTSMNTLLGRNSDEELTNAKDFIDKMRESGVSQQNAIKMYSAIKTYSVSSTLLSGKINSYVSAKI